MLNRTGNVWVPFHHSFDLLLLTARVERESPPGAAALSAAV